MESTFVKEGVRIDGSLIRYDTDLQDIQPSVVDKLSTETATTWSVFLIHRAIKDLGKDINKHLVCPINTSAIEGIAKKVAKAEAENLIKAQPAKVMNKVIAVIKDVILIATAAGLILTLLK